MIRCSIWMLPFDKTRFSQLNTVSADIVPHHRFSSVRAEETPQIVALNHILIATDFSVKLRVFNLQLGCAEFAVDGSVLGKLLLQTIDLRLELCSQPVCSVKSFCSLDSFFSAATYFFARVEIRSKSSRSTATLVEKGMDFASIFSMAATSTC